MIDIEPCPWCSSLSVWCYAKNDGYRVVCVRMAACRARGPVAKSRFEAIAAWNRVAGQRWRPIETAPEDRRGLIIHVEPGVGATHWRPALEPPEGDEA